MKRIHVVYDGAQYTIGNRDLDEVKAEIVSALTSATPLWLPVNFGEGVLQETELLITPGVGIAVTGIDPDDPAVSDGS